jgi:hypothetical protein
LTHEPSLGASDHRLIEHACHPSRAERRAGRLQGTRSLAGLQGWVGAEPLGDQCPPIGQYQLKRQVRAGRRTPERAFDWRGNQLAARRPSTLDRHWRCAWPPPGGSDSSWASCPKASAAGQPARYFPSWFESVRLHWYQSTARGPLPPSMGTGSACHAGTGLLA